MIGWILFILSIPSANVLVLVGVVVAHLARGGATGLARDHLDAQIRLFWSVFWWTVALWVVAIIAFVSVMLFPLGLIALLLLFLLGLWFTIKSLFGLIALAQNRHP